MKLSKSEILRLYSIVHVAMETTKTSNFTCQTKSFVKFQLVSCNRSLAMIWQMKARYSQTAKTLFSHLNRGDNNKRTLTGIAKWWLPPLDRGFIYNINHFSNYLCTSINGSLIEGDHKKEEFSRKSEKRHSPGYSSMSLNKQCFEPIQSIHTLVCPIY